MIGIGLSSHLFLLFIRLHVLTRIWINGFPHFILGARRNNYFAACLLVASFRLSSWRRCHERILNKFRTYSRYQFKYEKIFNFGPKYDCIIPKAWVLCRYIYVCVCVRIHTNIHLIISTNKCTKTSLSLFSLLKECPNTHFGNYITIIRGFF
jgi:hypothetical protein